MKRIVEQWQVFKSLRNRPLHVRVFRFIAGVLDAYHLHLSESIVTNILSILVGILAGYGAVLFRYLIKWFTEFWSGTGTPAIENLVPSLGVYAFVPVPIIGMVIVVFLVNRFAKEACGSGIPEVMESVALKSGRIRGRVAVVKSLASSICIGFGGSVGREGPIVQIGASIGSMIAGVLRMSRERRRWLVACGAGAGIAATFNAPIAGIVFAMEVILHGSSLRSFTSIVLATVSGSIIGRMYFGATPAFEIPMYTFESNLEIIFYVILGVLAGAVGLGYTRLVYFVEDIFNRIRLHPLWIAALGGLLIGLLGSIYPEVRGVGYDAMNLALNAEIVWQVMLVLMVIKMLATSITLGARGSGGVFAPALFIGAMLGGTCGTAFEALAPGETAGSQPYAMVGMAAVFAAAAHAPFSSIVILFEMTGNYNIIIPLMISVVIATVFSNHFLPSSIFTMKLERRGVRLRWGRNIDLLESIRVRDVMVTHIDTIPPDFPRCKLHDLILSTHHNGFPVVDRDGRLVGIVTLNDYSTSGHLAPDAPVDDFCSHELMTVFPSDNLSLALKRLRIRDIGRLVVVDPYDRTRLLGIITRTDVLTAYELALRHQETDDAEMDVGTCE